MDCARLVLVASTCLLVSVSGMINATEGEVCKEVNGKEWKCKTLADCQYSYEFLKDELNVPQFCKFKGSKPVVCCDPAFSVSKSNEMCKKYANEKDICGIETESLIPIGDRVSSNIYPHMALLGYGNSSSINWLCCGNLISKDYVLGAAHCNSNGKIPKWVKLGATTLEPGVPEDRSVTYEIAEIMTHPDYKQRSVYNDVALYKLKTPAQFTDSISPICLQKDHDLPLEFDAVGWDHTEFGNPRNEGMQVVHMTVIPWKACNDFYKTKATSWLTDGIKEDAMICAREYNARDSCSRVSEGSLLQSSKGVPCMNSLVATNSFSKICDNEYPRVFSRVSYYVPWIESVVWP